MNIAQSHNSRHVIALSILIFIYILPLVLPPADTWYWVRHVLISCLCILLLFKLAKIDHKILMTIFVLELIAMLATIMASKLEWFNDKFDPIMAVIFLFEITLVVGSAVLGPIHRNNQFGVKLRKLFNNVYNCIKNRSLDH